MKVITEIVIDFTPSKLGESFANACLIVLMNEAERLLPNILCESIKH